MYKQSKKGYLELKPGQNHEGFGEKKTLTLSPESFSDAKYKFKTKI